ncbi:MAG: ankyrin repeat domain-containing protein [Elusimicrobiaceae bacterium]|nr:ankyrin repeat domain-containing protein [Elusimicrobiaceae bacterium]MBT4007839.1 ankyrin repeat domain-containing protein [Elusimicrobiaceae bacterium]MBT5987251.1 ankyrin repeat domain-containing protein [Elusimicrobiaceae bacterium]MBT6715055.1 ankyrin repeat domain-containing protein [Elusimicrobiaceae bacterium]
MKKIILSMLAVALLITINIQAQESKTQCCPGCTELECAISQAIAQNAKTKKEIKFLELKEQGASTRQLISASIELDLLEEFKSLVNDHGFGVSMNGNTILFAVMLEKYKQEDTEKNQKTKSQMIEYYIDKTVKENMQWLFDIPNDNFDSPIHLAINKKDKELVQRLLDVDVNIDRTDGNGRTPFQLASYLGYENIADSITAKRKYWIKRFSNDIYYNINN